MVSCKGTKDGIIPKKMLVDIMEGYQSAIPRGIQWLSNTTDASMVNEDEYDIKKGRIPEMDHSLECSKGPGQGEISGDVESFRVLWRTEKRKWFPIS